MASKFVTIDGASDALEGFPAEAVDQRLHSSSLPLQLEPEPWEGRYIAPIPPIAANRAPVFHGARRRPTRIAAGLLLMGVFAAGIVVGSGWWRRQPPDAPSQVTLNLEESAPPPVPAAQPTKPDQFLNATAQVKPASKGETRVEARVGTRADAKRPLVPTKQSAPPAAPAIRSAAAATGTGRNAQPVPREVVEFLPLVAPAAPALAPESRQPVREPIAAPPVQPSSPAPVTSGPATAAGRPEGAPLLPPRAAPPTAAPPRVDPRVDEDGAIRATLGQYRDAYERLDATAAKRVWPGVDERALSKAFANLESQSITFDDCKTTVTGAAAVASCRGTATYMGRLGSRNSQTQSREWTFKLQKAGSAWEVRSVQVR